MKRMLFIFLIIASQLSYSQDISEILEDITYQYQKSNIYKTGINKIFNITLGQSINEIKGIYNNEKILIDINFKGFTKAMITYTPITKKVTTIVTIKKTNEDCQEEAEIISKIFETKYGKFNHKEDFYYKQENDTTLIVKCNPFKNIAIILNNIELNNLIKTETFQIHINNEKDTF